MLKSRINQIGLITIGLTLFHIAEDIGLVVIGRYTEVHLWMIILGTLAFSLVIGLISRIPKVRRFLR